MIRDSVIYIDMENVLSVDDNDKYYNTSLSTEDIVSKKVNSKLANNDESVKTMEQVFAKEKSAFDYTISSNPIKEIYSYKNVIDRKEVSNKKLELNTQNDVEVEELNTKVVQKLERVGDSIKKKYSIVYIRPTHCDSYDYINYIKNSGFCLEESVLTFSISLFQYAVIASINPGTALSKFICLPKLTYFSHRVFYTEVL